MKPTAHKLTEPEVVSCTFLSHVQPTLPALRLAWPADCLAANADRFWALPCGAHKAGPPPELFGIVIRRTAADRYSLRLVWDDTYLDWRQLRRKDLADSCLREVLAALNADIDDMLDQPIAPVLPSNRYLPPLEAA